MVTNNNTAEKNDQEQPKRPSYLRLVKPAPVETSDQAPASTRLCSNITNMRLQIAEIFAEAKKNNQK